MSSGPSIQRIPSTGYLHRSAPLSEGDLRALLAQVFSNQEIFAFGANTAEIQPITAYSSIAAVQLSGQRGAFELGHIFATHAEVRWKYDHSAYDALLLTEDIDLINKLGGPQAQFGQFTAQHANRKIDLVLNTPYEAQQRNMRWRLGYWEYRNTSGAVQFLRYTKQREELAR